MTAEARSPGASAGDAGYMYAWEFRVAEEQRLRFLEAYGPEGDWVALFRSAPGWIRTELHRDRRDPLRFVTLDYWESEAAWRRFREERAGEFEALDARCERLTLEERELGRFDPAAVAPREAGRSPAE